MGHWLYRLRVRFRALRFRRRERHHNRIIATQQQTISELSSQIEKVDSDWRKILEQERFDRSVERDRLAAQLSLAELQVTMLSEVVARDRARIEKEAAVEVRGAENARFGLEKPK
jgi:hypothetical protein